MTNKRRAVQDAHERLTSAYIESFNRRYHSSFAVVEAPNPLGAIIRSGRNTRWVDHGFLAPSLAIDVYSYATKGEVHCPIEEGLFVCPDEEFTKNFVSTVKRMGLFQTSCAHNRCRTPREKPLVS